MPVFRKGATWCGVVRARKLFYVWIPKGSACPLMWAPSETDILVRVPLSGKPIHTWVDGRCDLRPSALVERRHLDLLTPRAREAGRASARASSLEPLSSGQLVRPG